MTFRTQVGRSVVERSTGVRKVISFNSQLQSTLALWKPRYYGHLLLRTEFSPPPRRRKL